MRHTTVTSGHETVKSTNTQIRDHDSCVYRDPAPDVLMMEPAGSWYRSRRFSMAAFGDSPERQLPHTANL